MTDKTFTLCPCVLHSGKDEHTNLWTTVLYINKILLIFFLLDEVGFIIIRSKQDLKICIST